MPLGQSVCVGELRVQDWGRIEGTLGGALRLCFGALRHRGQEEAGNKGGCRACMCLKCDRGTLVLFAQIRA